MKTTHSPGPWKYNRMGTVGDFRIIGSEFLSGEAQTRHETGVAFNIYHEANARLIAAAPEMLEALRAINAALTQPVQFSGTDTPGTCNILRGDCQVAGSIARAAIAKATA